MLPAIPSGVGQAREQAPVVGKDASAVLSLRSGVDAAAVRSVVLRLEQVGSYLCVGYLLIALVFPDHDDQWSETASGRGRESAPGSRGLIPFNEGFELIGLSTCLERQSSTGNGL